MLPERRVRLFRVGRNQALRIPREFQLPGKEAVIRKRGSRLVVESIAPKSLLEVLGTFSPLEEEFPEIRDVPTRAVEL